MMSVNGREKTVFLVDHSVKTARNPGFFIDIETKNRSGIPVESVAKPIWTCMLEACLEYTRIVWDIYPNECFIRYVICDDDALKIGQWDTASQNVNYFMAALSTVGAPSSDSMIGRNFSVALEAMSEPTEKQRSGTHGNKGRVVCIGSFNDDKHVRNLEAMCQELLNQQNRTVLNSGKGLPISGTDLVFVNVYADHQTTKITDKICSDRTTQICTDVYSVRASALSNFMTALVLSHYDLTSTTVTGIPMKEEQNASSSANYDVEIFHPSAAMEDLIRGDVGGLVYAAKEGCEYHTATLKWNTPRVSLNDLWHCSSAFRIAPVDVNSRPSSCLTNFLLGGRSVMLEMPKPGGTKMLSHMLSSHGGEIFIHTLVTSRSVLEDPPSVSEGVGGKVSDYRLDAFADIIKACRLAPFPVPGREPPVTRAFNQLERYTTNWAITASKSYLAACQNLLGSLPSVIVKENLTDDEVNDCKKVIYTFIGMENRSESLPVSGVSAARSKKRDEQYRAFFAEMEQYLRAHNRSEQHRRVLDCLLECRSIVGDKSEDKQIDKTDKFGVVRSNTDSPMSPSPAKMPLLSLQGEKTRTLYDYWMKNIVEEQTKRRVEFVGRIKAGSGIAKLYQNFEMGKKAGADLRDVPV